mgnify:CR=1 FL=1
MALLLLALLADAGDEVMLLIRFFDTEEVEVGHQVISGLTLRCIPKNVGGNLQGASNEGNEDTSNLPGNDLLELRKGQVSVEALELLPEHACLSGGNQAH